MSLRSLPATVPGHRRKEQTMQRPLSRRSIWLGLGAVALAGCAGQTATIASQPAFPPPAPGTARVWFLRQPNPQNGFVEAAEPAILANGQPVGYSKAGAVFYRDFARGTYSFKVGPTVGLPTGQAATLQLAPGTETYLQVQWVASWEFGYPEAGWSFAPNSFAIVPISPQLAKAYIPTMAFISQR
jgi:hypothetical protein